MAFPGEMIAMLSILFVDLKPYIRPSSHERRSTGQLTAISYFLKLWRALFVKMFEKFPKINNVYFLAIVATMGGMLFGFDISSMSAIIPTRQYMQVTNFA